MINKNRYGMRLRRPGVRSKNQAGQGSQPRDKMNNLGARMTHRPLLGVNGAIALDVPENIWRPLLGVLLVLAALPFTSRHAFAWGDGSQAIVPPEQAWYVNDYLSCDFTNKYLFQSSWPGDDPIQLLKEYAQKLDEMCSGTAGASYTVTYTVNACTPNIIVSSNGANPRAFAVATGCTIRKHVEPKPTCVGSCQPYTADVNAPAAEKICALEGYGNGSQFTLTSAPSYGECMCPEGAAYLSDGTSKQCVVPPPLDCTDGDSDCKDMGPPPCPNPVGNPINAGTSNKFQRDIDLSIRGRAENLTFQRYYNSRSAPKPGAFGPQWRYAYERSAIISLEAVNNDAVYTARLVRPDGRVFVFREYSCQNCNLWQGDADIRGEFQRISNGYEYKSESITETYDTDGVLQSITDHRANTQTLTYDAHGRLARVDSNTGEYLSLGYDANNRIDMLTDHANRVWHYRYDVVGNLEYVDNPDGTSKQYHYEDANFPHALTGITDERGVRYATFGYDTSGRANLSTHAGNAQRVDIVYNGDGTRTVTNSRGQPSTYTTTEQIGVSLVADISGPGCSTCSTGNTSYSYDPDNNNLLSKTDNGVATSYGDYDSKGQYGYKTEAVGTAAQRRTDYTYDPRFYNKVTTVTESSVYEP